MADSRRIYLHGNRTDFFHNVINKSELVNTLILPETDFYKNVDNHNDKTYYYISCYDGDNFNSCNHFDLFSMETASPLMTMTPEGKCLEEIYNDPTKLDAHFAQNNILIRIPNIIRKHIKEGKVKVILFHALEGYHSVNMNYIKKLLGVDDMRNVIFLTGDYRYRNPVTGPTGVTTMWINYWERSCAGLGVHDPSKIEFYLNSYKNDIDKNKTRNYMNTFYNRRIRDHRINAMSVLHKENLLEKMIWSWGGSIDQYTTEQLKIEEKIDNFIQYQYINNTGEEYRNSIKEVLSWGNLQNGKESIEDLNINLVNTVNEEHLLDSYYQLICETWATNDTTFLSEKSFKPFLLAQPFLTWADINTVGALKQLGYDTFDDIFSHLYDNEPNNKLRLLKLKDEIKRINIGGNRHLFKNKIGDKNYIRRLRANYDNLINSFNRNGIDFKYLENKI